MNQERKFKLPRLAHNKDLKISFNILVSVILAEKDSFQGCTV